MSAGEPGDVITAQQSKAPHRTAERSTTEQNAVQRSTTHHTTAKRNTMGKDQVCRVVIEGGGEGCPPVVRTRKLAAKTRPGQTCAA